MAQDYNTSFDIRLPATPNNKDSESFNDLLIVYNSIRLLADAVERRFKKYVIFSESCALGELVSFQNFAGVPKIRKAVHNTYPCHGFVSIAAGIDVVGEVTLFGDYYPRFPAGTLVTGTTYYRSATPGALTSVSPGAGAQVIGYAISDIAIWFQAELNA